MSTVSLKYLKDMFNQLKKAAHQGSQTKKSVVQKTLTRWLLIMVMGILAYGFGLWRGQEFRFGHDQQRQMASISTTKSAVVSGSVSKSNNTGSLKSGSK